VGAWRSFLAIRSFGAVTAFCVAGATAEQPSVPRSAGWVRPSPARLPGTFWFPWRRWHITSFYLRLKPAALSRFTRCHVADVRSPRCCWHIAFVTRTPLPQNRCAGAFLSAEPLWNRYADATRRAFLPHAGTFAVHPSLYYDYSWNAGDCLRSSLYCVIHMPRTTYWTTLFHCYPSSGTFVSVPSTG